jgi:hypothetical protein
MTITVDRFLAGVKRRITMPSNQVLLKDDAILEIADDCMRDQVVPFILSTNQNYFATVETVPVVDGVDKYDVPERSMGQGLRDLKLMRDANASNVSDLSLIALEDAHYFAEKGQPTGFYFMGDQIVLVPGPVGDAYSLLVYYNIQQNKLKPTTQAAMVSSVSGDTVVCTSAGSGLISGTKVDFIKGKSGCRILGKDIAIQSVSGVTFTFATDAVPDDVVAGDYIALAKTTPLLQIPDEVQPYFEAVTCERCLESIGDYEGAQKINSKMAEFLQNAAKVLSPRVEGETTKIVNRKGLLRGKGFSYWRNRGGFI